MVILISNASFRSRQMHVFFDGLCLLEAPDLPEILIYEKFIVIMEIAANFPSIC